LNERSTASLFTPIQKVQTPLALGPNFMASISLYDHKDNRFMRQKQQGHRTRSLYITITNSKLMRTILTTDLP
ncbi:hypothetical protein PanWU01x14_197510, partial [Parasponia andersonii]